MRVFAKELLDAKAKPWAMKKVLQKPLETAILLVKSHKEHKTIILI